MVGGIPLVGEKEQERENERHVKREKERDRRDEERRGGARVCEQERDRGKVPLNKEPIL